MKNHTPRVAASQARVTTSTDAPASGETAHGNADGGSDDDADGDRKSGTVQVPVARHEIVTGPGEDDKIAPGTEITEELATEHGLSDKDAKRLIACGAVELVDVRVAA